MFLTMMFTYSIRSTFYDSGQRQQSNIQNANGFVFFVTFYVDDLAEFGEPARVVSVDFDRKSQNICNLQLIHHL